MAGGEAGGLGQAGPDRVLEGLVLVGGEVAQLRHGRVVIEGVGGQRHRPRDQPVDQGRGHGVHATGLKLAGKPELAWLWISLRGDARGHIKIYTCAMEHMSAHRIQGPERARLAKQLAQEYEGGRSIRELGAKYGLSIGVVRRLLTERGVTFRGRGGANRRPKT